MSEHNTAVEALQAAIATPLESNDLGRLAQMHTAFQTLASMDPPAGPLAAASANLLEGVILNEAADAAAGLAAIPEAVGLLAAAAGGESIDPAEVMAMIQAAATGEATDGAAAPAEASAVDASAEGATAPEPGPEASTPEPDEAPSEPVTSDEPAATAASAESAPAGDAPAIEPYVSEPLMLDMSEREHIQGFVEESREHLDAIETALLEVENDPSDTSKINELFRPFHTIKGIAGFLNLRDVNRLTHQAETILDMGRKSELEITPDIIDLIFTSIDFLKAQIDAIADYLADPTGDAVPQPDIVDIMARLSAVAAGGEAEPAEAASSTPAPEPADQPEPAPTAQDQPAADAAPPAEAPADRSEPASAPAAEVSGDQVAAPEAPAEKPAAAAPPSKPASGEGAASKSSGEKGGKHAADLSIRVDTAKLDRLVDAVGELVIAQTMVNLNSTVGRDEKLSRDVTQVTKIVRDVQETAMAMRMVPIAHTFQKMRRVVRDVARKAGKQVELEISGEETELDKNVIQAISDPLVHMVRNAVDHGIGTPEQRKAAGKPEQGRVTLNAYYQGDTIVIEIGDDGRGLDREKLLKKGIERGIVNPDDTLTDQQVFSLIFAAGFSLAEKVTDISGRGVGMDVVRRNIEQLRGKIEIDSELGRGSVFRIRLPLTLAIIDGMIVRSGDERLIIPTIMIEQSLRPESSQITRVHNRGEIIRVRGELIPLIQLAQLFDYGGRREPCSSLVIIAHAEGQKIGLVVDELIGQQQVVIKTLGDRFKHLIGISGAAILGDGHVGLILEPSGILKLHNRSMLPAVGPSESVAETVSAEQLEPVGAV